MGSPGFSMRLRKDASAAQTGKIAQNESAYPLLLARMSAGSPGPGSGGSTDDGPGPGGPDSGQGGPASPEPAAMGPQEHAQDSSSSQDQAVAEARSPGRMLHVPRRVRRPRRGRPRSADADRVILVAAAEVMAEKGINGL